MPKSRNTVKTKINYIIFFTFSWKLCLIIIIILFGSVLNYYPTQTCFFFPNQKTNFKSAHSLNILSVWRVNWISSSAPLKLSSLFDFPTPRSESRTCAGSWPDPTLYLIAAINGPSALSIYDATAGWRRYSALRGEVREGSWLSMICSMRPWSLATALTCSCSKLLGVLPDPYNEWA